MSLIAAFCVRRSLLKTCIIVRSSAARFIRCATPGCIRIVQNLHAPLICRLLSVRYLGLLLVLFNALTCIYDFWMSMILFSHRRNSILPIYRIIKWKPQNVKSRQTISAYQRMRRFPSDGNADRQSLFCGSSRDVSCDSSCELCDVLSL